MTNHNIVPESSVEDTLISQIKAFIQHHPPPDLAAGTMLSTEKRRQLGFTPRILFPIAVASHVAKAEARIGFLLPRLLKRLYLEISNGIAGFAYDIMGLEGGCASDSGGIVEAYIEFSTGNEFLTSPWKAGLLPFCNWGCAIYSCVDCTDSAYPILTYENLDVWAEQYTLAEFFAMWLNGKVLFSQENVEFVTEGITNPFTGKPTTMSTRIRKRRS